MNGSHALPSLTYANNVGPDATTVSNAALLLSSPGCSGPAPCPFDLAVPFTSPFSFDPANGRLLVDIVSSAITGTPTGSLDAVLFPDTTSSTVAIVIGDPTQAAGTLNVAGIVLGLDISAASPGPTVTKVLIGDSRRRARPLLGRPPARAWRPGPPPPRPATATAQTPQPRARPCPVGGVHTGSYPPARRRPPPDPPGSSSRAPPLSKAPSRWFL